MDNQHFTTTKNDLKASWVSFMQHLEAVTKGLFLSWAFVIWELNVGINLRKD